MTGPWHVTAHTVPRAGHAPHENEDAWATARPGGDLIAAVADGATETAFARVWAQGLAAWAAATGSVAGAWERAAPAHAAHVAARTATMPWYAVQKAEEGAAAALLVVRLRPDGAFEAEAVGDACLLVVHGGRVEAAWPLDTPGAFSHRPALVSSHQPPARVERLAGRLTPGRTLLLATDALAAFLLREGADASNRSLSAPSLATARRRGLRNDDTTLVAISRPAPA